MARDVRQSATDHSYPTPRRRQRGLRPRKDLHAIVRLATFPATTPLPLRRDTEGTPKEYPCSSIYLNTKEVVEVTIHIFQIYLKIQKKNTRFSSGFEKSTHLYGIFLSI